MLWGARTGDHARGELPRDVGDAAGDHVLLALAEAQRDVLEEQLGRPVVEPGEQPEQLRVVRDLEGDNVVLAYSCGRGCPQGLQL